MNMLSFKRKNAVIPVAGNHTKFPHHLDDVREGATSNVSRKIYLNNH